MYVPTRTCMYTCMYPHAHVCTHTGRTIATELWRKRNSKDTSAGQRLRDVIVKCSPELGQKTKNRTEQSRTSLKEPLRPWKRQNLSMSTSCDHGLAIVDVLALYSRLKHIGTSEQIGTRNLRLVESICMHEDARYDRVHTTITHKSYMHA